MSLCYRIRLSEVTGQSWACGLYLGEGGPAFLSHFHLETQNRWVGDSYLTMAENLIFQTLATIFMDIHIGERICMFLQIVVNKWPLSLVEITSAVTG